MTVIIMYVLVPMVITLVCFVVILVHVHAAKPPPSYKPPAAFSWDYSLMKTNLLSFVLFVVSISGK